MRWFDDDSLRMAASSASVSMRIAASLASIAGLLLPLAGVGVALRRLIAGDIARCCGLLGRQHLRALDLALPQPVEPA